MLKKLPYKAIVLSTLLTCTATMLTPPVTTFAEEVEQSNPSNNDLSANTDKMQEMLERAGEFAEVMNRYSYMLIRNPDVNFQGIDIKGHSDLPGKVVQDQQNARNHANTWDTQVKRQLIDTLTGIIVYDTTFDNYYDLLVQASQNGNKEVLTEGITDLQSDIQNNKQKAVVLIDALGKLKDSIGEDSRAFQTNKDTLSSILKNQTTGLDDDEIAMQKVLDEINHFKRVRRDGTIVVAIPTIWTWISGGIMLGVAQAQLNKLEPLLEQLNQTIDYKKTLNRVVGVAANSVNEMHTAIDNAIAALTFMKTQWDDLDAQYMGVLESIEVADKKISTDKFTFLIPTLNTAKENWKALKTDATTLKEGLKELKIDEVPAQK
ncbi:HBL/NHE enterotoxin family protein [Bacillus cereus]|uniref:HBL/NHE enterotoxin family protein n=1 Tax=Bacillus cereus TaxID=1396 RepID=UPI0018CDCBDF|nr:HBL/NHE enterotoxin family protein [Bacillus cereus]MBG9612217.1 hemolysin [Bacillus cereus]